MVLHHLGRDDSDFLDVLGTLTGVLWVLGKIQHHCHGYCYHSSKHIHSSS